MNQRHGDRAAMNLPPVIDLEASGLGRGSFPIEVGVVLPCGLTYCSLICPEPDWCHWDEQAEQLHGISRELLRDAGKPAAQVAQELNDFIGSQRVFSDAWGNDSSWLGLLFYYGQQPQAFKLESLRSIISEQQLPFWHTCKEQVIYQCQFRRHRASNDARILQLTYQRSQQMALQQASGAA